MQRILLTSESPLTHSHVFGSVGYEISLIWIPKCVLKITCFIAQLKSKAINHTKKLFLKSNFEKVSEKSRYSMSFLETMVIIKIESHSYYPLICDWFSFALGWNRFFFEFSN